MTGSAGDGAAPLLRPGFGRRMAVAALVAIGLAIVVQVAGADGPDGVSGGLGGDYPAFYAVGDLVLDDPGLAPEALYDPTAQFAAQEPVLPADEGGNLYFAYPAFFVAPFVPLAALDFRWSYLAAVALMVAAVVLALRLLRPCSAVVREHPVEVLAVCLGFYPLFRGTTGGQNTALVLLCCAAAWRSLHDGREVPAGIAAGLLLFKPPLALPFIGGLLLARRYRAVAASAATGAVLWGIGAALTGPGWVSAWTDALRFLDRVDTPANVQNFVSLPGVAEAVFGIDSTAATVVGYGLALGVIALVSLRWLRGPVDPAAIVAITTVGALLMSPHALYYDAGLLVLVGLVLHDRRPDLRRWLPLAWLAGLLHLGAETFDADPLVLLVVAGFAVAWQVLPGERSRAGAEPANPAAD